MSIDRVSISNGAIDRALQSYGIEGRASEQPKQAPAGNDQLVLSDAAREAERVANMAEQARADRFEAVRQAIANGTYHVSGENIASKVIELNTK